MSTSSFTEDELEAFLNRMLESERAGARALVVFLDDFAREDEIRKILRRVHEEEAHNCALIGEQLKKRGRQYSHATGEFYAKAVAVSGRRRRIEFLVRGLGWAVRKLEEALPRIGNPEVRNTIGAMRETHLRSIEACNAVARGLSAEGGKG